MLSAAKHLLLCERKQSLRWTASLLGMALPENLNGFLL